MRIRREEQKRKVRHIRHEEELPTQEQLLAEAKITEEENYKSLGTKINLFRFFEEVKHLLLLLFF